MTIQTTPSSAYTNKLRVAIVTPIYQSDLTEEQQHSISALKKHLGTYDRYLIHPQHLPFHWDTRGFTRVPMSNRHFHNTNTYSLMCLNPNFYRHFSKYDYILIYQTDALVFNDRLLDWCQKGYSYIGAPMMTRRFSIIKNTIMKRLFGTNLRHSSKHHQLVPIQNGGFSLRNVTDCITLLNTKLSLTKKIRLLWQLDIHRWQSRSKHSIAGITWSFLTTPNMRLGKFLRLLVFGITDWSGEDQLFSIAAKISPSFTMPSAKKSLQFATGYFDWETFFPSTVPFGAHSKDLFTDAPTVHQFYQRFGLKHPMTQQSQPTPSASEGA
jgi:hypothetical protein